MNELQKALRMNVIFSSISGTIMILFNNQLEQLFGTSNNTIFWIIGLVLIFFSATIAYEIKKQRKLAVLWIVTQDFLWVLGSILLIIFNPFQITAIGNFIIGFIALVVLYMGINQTNKLHIKNTNK